MYGNTLHSFCLSHSWNNKLVSWHQDISFHLDSHLQNLCQFCIEITDCCQLSGINTRLLFNLDRMLLFAKYFPFQQVQVSSLLLLPFLYSSILSMLLTTPLKSLQSFNGIFQTQKKLTFSHFCNRYYAE